MEATRPTLHPASTFGGLYAGRVVDVDDNDKRGRVKVVVPAVFDGDGADAAVWARPCVPFGLFFVPDVGTRVWVMFEAGEPSAPVWIGTWYQSGSTPSDAAVTPPVKRLVHTAAGNQVLLDDTDGSEKLVIRDAKGSRIELTGSAVLVHAEQNLTIEAPGKSITVKGSSIALEATTVDVRKPGP